MSQFTMQPLPGLELQTGCMSLVSGSRKKVLTYIFGIYIFQTYYEHWKDIYG
jgi:hypothetical protein